MRENIWQKYRKGGLVCKIVLTVFAREFAFGGVR